MAGGEKAKSSGEYGEQIVKNILELMGWNNANSGVTVPCVHKEKHKKENLLFTPLSVAGYPSLHLTLTKTSCLVASLN